MKNISRKYGFTLLELLVVVIIIAVLAAVAWPQYKHAVLKSRFSKVMPVAKAIADAQEVYYLGRQLYALDVEELDVTSVETENTSVTLSQMDGYDYVMAQHSQVPGGHYIIYQKYSENYPGEIHCEAEDNNADAQWVCGTLSNNNRIGTTVTSGYTTYLIKGPGAGIAPGADNDPINENGEVVPGCESAVAMGLSCNITMNEAGERVKQVCQNGFCRTKTYNENGGYTSVTCQTDSAGVCTSNWKSVTYDADGKKLTERTCSSVDSSENCTAYSGGVNYTYDTKGNMLTERTCSSVDSNGNCTAYSSGMNYTYDANGKKLESRRCTEIDSSGNCTSYQRGAVVFYTYDAKGNLLKQRICTQLYVGGNCARYGVVYNYTYDANGNMLMSRYCAGLDTDKNTGECLRYESGNNSDYTYDANGNLLTVRTCHVALGGEGGSNKECFEAYSRGINYTYDANGNQLTERTCSSVDSSGNCTAYSSGKNYTYDAKGNQLTSRTCSSVDSNGNCEAYSSGSNYTYDAKGNQLTSRICSSVDSNGNCTAYSASYTYMYDEDGKRIAQQYCSGSNLDTTTGECMAYNSTITERN